MLRSGLVQTVQPGKDLHGLREIGFGGRLLRLFSRCFLCGRFLRFLRGFLRGRLLLRLFGYGFLRLFGRRILRGGFCRLRGAGGKAQDHQNGQDQRDHTGSVFHVFLLHVWFDGRLDARAAWKQGTPEMLEDVRLHAFYLSSITSKPSSFPNSFSCAASAW